jgi:hypothetical protein
VSIVLERSARGLLELLELLDSGMKPPICRSCRKAEWNHVCKDQSSVSEAQQELISDLRAMDDESFAITP